MKKIAVIQDLSGLGKCSLTAAIPVISVMGVQAVPLPTAVLSNQTGYPSYYACDYTDHMEKVMDEWEKLGFAPTGFIPDSWQTRNRQTRSWTFSEDFEARRPWCWWTR